MTDTQTISGHLSEKDVKRLTQLTRGAMVGPTVVYYAGATAPIISAAMAMLVREAVRKVGMSDYWQWFISALIAAFAGIAWYLIFIRWSYRHTHGQGTEVALETRIVANKTGVIVARGDIETRIGWKSIRRVSVDRKSIAILVTGADAIVIPHKWFGKDKEARIAFADYLKEKATEYGS